MARVGEGGEKISDALAEVLVWVSSQLPALLAHPENLHLAIGGEHQGMQMLERMEDFARFGTFQGDRGGRWTHGLIRKLLWRRCILPERPPRRPSGAVEKSPGNSLEARAQATGVSLTENLAVASAGEERATDESSMVSGADRQYTPGAVFESLAPRG